MTAKGCNADATTTYSIQTDIQTYLSLHVGPPAVSLLPLGVSATWVVTGEGRGWEAATHEYTAVSVLLPTVAAEWGRYPGDCN